MSFLVVSGGGQSGVVGQALASPLVIKATDSKGKALRHVLVAFSVTSGGGSASPATATTNNQGLAQTSWTLGTSTATAQRLEARAVSNGQVFGSFTATALPEPAAAITKIAGDSQSAPVRTTVPVAPAVLITDRYGNPVPGVSVAFAVQAGGGSVTASPAVSGANGIATVGSWRLGSAVGTNHMAASFNGTNVVDFVATALLGTGARISVAAGLSQRTKVNVAVPIAPAVRITDASGNPLEGVRPIWGVVQGGGSFATGDTISGPDGVARLASWTPCCATGLYIIQATVPGIVDTVKFFAVADPTAPATISIFAGNGQTAVTNTDVAQPPIVMVKDTFNNGVPLVPVTFTVTAGGGSITGQNPTATDFNAVARLVSWTMGPEPGTNTLTVVAEGVATPATITATATAPVVDAARSTMVITPDTITVSTGAEIATITVTARDAAGMPVGGAQVVFSVNGAAVLAPSVTTTNTQGVATATITSSVAGLKFLSARMNGTSTGLRVLRVLPGPPVAIAVHAGDHQAASAGTPVAIRPEVVVSDTFGNGVNHVAVQFAVASGGGSIGGPSTVSTTGFGRAAIGSWTLGPTAGPNTLTATLIGTALTTTFTATALQQAASIEVYAGDGQSAAPRTAVAVQPAVLARDASGNPMSGAVVDFAVAPGSGFLDGPASKTTSLDGTARVDAWTLGDYETNRLTARVRGTELSVTFTATGAGSQWDRLADLPTPRLALGAANVNGVVYAVGGLFDGYVANLDAYDPATNTWMPRAPLPAARGEIGVGVVDGVLYAVGGNTGSGYDPTAILATVEAYDPATNTWTPRASMPTPRAGLAVVVADGILYAISGYACQPPAGQPCVASSPLAAVATVEAYDPATNSWTTKASLPTPRAYPAAAAIDGVIYAIGGQANDFPFWLTTVEAYNPSTDTWTVRAPLPTGRVGLGVEVVNGVLYAIGGYGGGLYENRAVEAYDAVSNTWTVLPPMVVGRWYLATTVLNGFIYVIGGNGAVELVETFRP